MWGQLDSFAVKKGIVFAVKIPDRTMSCLIKNNICRHFAVRNLDRKNDTFFDRKTAQLPPHFGLKNATAKASS